MSEEVINNAILTLDTLIDCCKEDGTYYNAQKEWEALEVFKKLQQENTHLKSVLKEIREYIEKHKFAYENPLTRNIYNVSRCDEVLEKINKVIGENK